MAEVGRRYFGSEQLRPGQQEAAVAALGGRDTLAVMPAGSGKSALYQIVGLLKPRATVVVSPLIALQLDQSQSRDGHGLGQAAVVNSAQLRTARPPTLQRAAGASWECVFLAPEQFSQPDTLAALRAAPPALFVVDEAHCISHWGHSFRPDYLKLGAVLEELGHPTVLALTATASPRVREEIIARLGMRDPLVMVRGFDRPNITLTVQAQIDAAAKLRALTYRVSRARTPGIVYVATRRHAVELAENLAEQGHHALAYHGGMAAAERQAIQDAFMSSKVDVLVATNAFGMGVDKADVHFVYHFDVSDSLDSYYQEIGRAGRDGKPAEAVLFYRPADLGLHRFFAGGGQVDADDIRRVAEAIQAAGGPIMPKDLHDALDLSASKRQAAIHSLENVGAIEVLPTGELVPRGRRIDSAGAGARAAQHREDLHRYELSRIEMMQAYAETTECRRKYLLNYFGEHFDAPCDHCDNCRSSAATRPPGAAESEESTPARPFPAKSFVLHQHWGKGMVVRYDRQKIVILFDEGGYKTFQLATIMQSGLLRAAP